MPEDQEVQRLDDSRVALEIVQAARERRTFGLRDTRPNDGEDAPILMGATLSRLLRGSPAVPPLDHVDLRGVVLVGDVDLAYVRFTGLLRLADCLIKGRLILTRARIEGLLSLNGSRVLEVKAAGAHINGSIEMRDGFIAECGVLGSRLVVTESLRVGGARLTAPKDNPSRAALDVYRAQIGDFFGSGAVLDGGLYMVGSIIQRNVRLQGAKVRSRSSCGFDSNADAGPGVGLASSDVGGSIFLSGTKGDLYLQGEVSLRGTSCHRFVASAPLLESNELDLADFTYERLADDDWKRLFCAIERRRAFAPTSYRQLSEYLRKRGDLLESTKVEVALQRRYSKMVAWWTWEGLRRRVLGMTVRYGYRPAMALLWLGVCLALASCVIALHHDVFIYTGEGGTAQDGMAWTQVLALGVDAVVPLVQVGIKDWVLNIGDSSLWPWLGALLVLKFLGWALALLAAGSISGLIQTD